MEIQTAQIRHQVRQGVFPVLVKEEPGVGKAGGDHPLVALADQTLRIITPVHHGQEPRCQLTVRVLKDQALLVVPEGGDDHLLRQLEKALIEGPQQQARELDELDMLGHKGRIGVDTAVEIGHQPICGCGERTRRSRDPPGHGARPELFVAVGHLDLEGSGEWTRWPTVVRSAATPKSSIGTTSSSSIATRP